MKFIFYKIFHYTKRFFLFLKNAINLLINSILFSFIYFAGVGMSFVIVKIIRKQLLKTVTRKNAATYWEDIKETKDVSYLKQF